MQTKDMVGFALSVRDPSGSARWFAEYFGFAVNVDLGWYANTTSPDLAGVSLDFLARDSESWPEGVRGRGVSGAMVAFLVADVDAEDRRLRAAGAEFALDTVTEPWGQRRLQVRGPEGVVVEVLQVVAPDPEWSAANGL
ncbi:VOC family protein [Streptomonospora salina]|uniref:Catechol 2,3-dioxygenase-like lactoylglutathione lyase family enzyme n=1 Tax=Streptomonospora salina TaxID=104205 RepID=A0A841EIK3_9ACTN|nr:VOC family protein [Streptomonospora salina]MBB6000873.1 catechol 2,3-dioxygenase-like lactoylglutathione lyase family enzyme [Streptomonospora salina]